MKKVNLIFFAFLMGNLGFQGCKSDGKFNVEKFKEGEMFEFHYHLISSGFYDKECKDPTIRKITVLDNKTAKIYVWNKACPIGTIEEDSLIYNYKIDNSANYGYEHGNMIREEKVIVLENNNAGYLNGHMYLEKKYLITNAYNAEDDKFIEVRLFNQLDKKEYPGRNSEFVESGGLKIN
jgi:hypothetical protein